MNGFGLDRLPRAGWLAVVVWGLLLSAAHPADERIDPVRAPFDEAAELSSVDFARDVIPALTKAGCNSGACHGSFQGRGGLQLSLLGFDPQVDYETLVKAGRGRRLNIAAPEESLVLLKGTGRVPHGGGRPMSPGSQAARLVEAYIARGAPPPDRDAARIVALTVTPPTLTLASGQESALIVSARWSDGRDSDVTPWALFDARDASLAEVSRTGVVTAGRPGKTAVMVRHSGQAEAVDITIPYRSENEAAADAADFQPAGFIDELVAAEWRRVGLSPVERSNDVEFLRRVSLDLIGTLPTPDEVRQFTSDQRTDKRAILIDALLERPEYADFWSVKWGDLLRVHRRYVGDKGLASFSGWIRNALRRNRPLDETVRELLTSQGNVFQSGPAAYYFVDEKPEDLAETTAQVFLGVRLQCARCHHHPMEAWGQADYYGLAAFFTRLEIKQPQEGGSQGRFGGMRILRPIATESPQRAMKVAAAPRMLGADDPVETDGGDIRRALAQWLTAAENPFFARNIANRYWAYLMGRGLVEPIDDQRVTNPPTNPALLEALAADFVAHGFDLKHLLRTICNSEVYQRASRLEPADDAEGIFYASFRPRRLPAEVLLDAINQACGHVEDFAGMPAGMRAISLPDPAIASRFLDTFGRPVRNTPCECARPGSPDLAQALHLFNGEALHRKIVSDQGRVARLVSAGGMADLVASELYLWTLSRPPAAEERATALALVHEAPSPREGLEDLLWALLNSGEFSFNH